MKDSGCIKILSIWTLSCFWRILSIYCFWFDHYNNFHKHFKLQNYANRLKNYRFCVGYISKPMHSRSPNFSPASDLRPKYCTLKVSGWLQIGKLKSFWLKNCYDSKRKTDFLDQDWSWTETTSTIDIQTP